MTVQATVIGSGVSGVIHVGFRKWITETAAKLGVQCAAMNDGETVQLLATGEPKRLHQLLLAARSGSPRSRVLAVESRVIQE
jgi:acylphosphatase